MDEIFITNKVEISVGILWNEDTRTYTWKFVGENVNPANGNFQLPGPGKSAIIYTLDADSKGSYQLLYVNLDPESCATYEIEQVGVDQKNNSITIIDRNSWNYTRLTPFCLRLVARRSNNIGSGFLSPDPQVTNNPNYTQGGGT